MDTNLIFQFRAVIESATIARAAEVLHMTPGALSRAIKRLEGELGTVLFLPSGRNIVATDSARSFYRSSEEIIRSIQVAKESVSGRSLMEKKVRLSTFEVFSTHFISWAIAHDVAVQPTTVFERTPGAIEASILGGDADCGITYIPDLHPELDHIRIGEMEFGVYRSPHGKNQDLPFAVPITELGTNVIQAKSLDGWPIGKQREIRFKFEMLETALDLATRGKCRICCPKFIVKLENERLKASYSLIEERQDFRLPKFKVYMIKRKSEAESKFFKNLARSVRVILAE